MQVERITSQSKPLSMPKSTMYTFFQSDFMMDIYSCKTMSSSRMPDDGDGSDIVLGQVMR